MRARILELVEGRETYQALGTEGILPLLHLNRFNHISKIVNTTH